MTYGKEKLTKVVLALKLLVWTFMTAAGLIMNMFFPKKKPNDPYASLDGDSKTIRALNYR